MPTKKNNKPKEKLNGIWDLTEKRFENAKEKTEDTIKEHPYVSIIVAASVGAIAGIVTSEIINGIRRKNERSIMSKIKRMF